MRKLKNINNIPENAVYDEMDSPVGKLTIVASSEGVHALLWEHDCKEPKYKKILGRLSKSKNEKMISETKMQLKEYFQGKRKKFDLPLAIKGTDFQMQAWKQLLKIPYAKTISYGEQAQRVGDKNKSRAVGMANGRNPVSIIIPCHRVIGSDGKLVGFGGGVDRKAYLLELEQKSGA